MTRQEDTHEEFMSGGSGFGEVGYSTLLRAHYAFQAGCFLSKAEERLSGIFCSSETNAPIWNHAAWLDANSADFEEFLRAALAWQSEIRRPVVYLVDPTAAQRKLVEAQRFEKFDEELWMVTSPQGTVSPRVSEAEELRDYLHVFKGAFGTTDSCYEAALSRARASRHRHFVLYSNATPVAIGTLVASGGLGCLYNIGTLPTARRQGFAAELVRHLLASIKNEGCEKVFLQVQRGGAANRLYEKLGFQPAFTRTGFQWKDWRARRTLRTQLSQVLPAAHRCETASVARQSCSLPIAVDATTLCQRIQLGAWAYLLHRYTSLETVTVWYATENLSAIRRLTVRVPGWEKVSQWIETLPVDGESVGVADAENLICCNSCVAHREKQAGSIPLQLHVTKESVQIVYREDIFSKDAIRRMAGHYCTILQSLLRAPDSQVKDIELLSDAERHRLLVELNQPFFDATGALVSRLFEEQVERTPEAVAVLLVSNSGSREQLSYRQLNRKANRLAHRLQEVGIGPEVAVGMLLDRSIESLVSLLAIFKAGGIFVPLDPASPADRIGYILREVDAGVLITDRRRASALHLARGPHVLQIEDTFEHLPHKNLAAKIQCENTAYIIYTSGSTGKPKGVIIDHRAIASHAIECRKEYGINSKDRVLQFSPFHFDASLEQIVPALISGATLVLPGDKVWTGQEFSNVMRAEQLTVIDLPTAYWNEMVEYWEANPAAAARNSLRLAIVGGEALAWNNVDKWYSTPLSKVRLINAYGPTEATITSTSYDVRLEERTANEITVPIGRLRGGRRAYVLDTLGRPVPIGIAGELHIGGPLLARGYCQQPEQTATRFIQDPFSDDPEAHLYKTGDIVRYREDGILEFLGRIDDQVKIRGFRIELGEVEASLREHPGVRDVLVTAKPVGAGEKRLVAYVTNGGDGCGEIELKKFLRDRLPEYMIPARIFLLNKWPLLTNGKVDRRALPALEEHAGDSTAGPRDPLELQLQLSFERVLKRAPIGVDESFFELGGDSLQALELLVQVEKETGRQLPLATLYQASTVEAVARELRRQVAPEQWSSLVPLQARGSRAPLYLLHTTPGDILGYGNLVYRLGPDRPCYGFQSLGLKDAHLSHTSIEEMARYYVDLVRRFQPHGPYYLGGWCYGGILAVEMARLLKAQGEPIGLLALLETVAMPARLSNYRYYTHRLRCLLRMSPARWVVYAREKQKYRRTARVANRMRFREVNRASNDSGDARLAQLEHVYKTNLTALNRYRSEYYDGTVTLFNASERDKALIPDPQYGWVGLAREIQIYKVPGNHDTMLAEPNVAVLAGELNKALKLAEERTSP